ncbi:MAG: hypothetical protein QM723_25825 [Myxococcaceae bacterium]
MALRVSNESSQWLNPETEPTESTGSTEAAPAAAAASTAKPDGLEPFAGATPAAGGAVAQKYSLDDAVDRRMLIDACPQRNAISAAAKNGDRICAGAALTNALILTGDTADNRAANAAALASVAKSLDVQLPKSVKQADVDAALKSYASGSMSPKDVQLLQQLTYAMGRSIQKGDDTGTNAPAMGILVNQLASAGARFQGAELVMTAGKNAHWLAVADGVVADSDPARTAIKGNEPLLKPSQWGAGVSAPKTPRGDTVVRLRGGGELKNLADGQGYTLNLRHGQSVADALFYVKNAAAQARGTPLD